MSILVLNAGSSSVKAALFGDDLTALASLTVSEIGPQAQMGGASVAAPDHASAIAVIIAKLTAIGHGPDTLSAAAHRVVHGGASLTAPARVTAIVRDAIVKLVPLAPLHNPANLAGIDAIAAIAPALPQIACFDTAFHATNPGVATAYAIPATEQAKGIRRYGFHGISYADLATRILPRPDRLLAFHLGNGASLCAIRGGHSVATTMGYSPVDGLTMGTRSGSIDPNAVLRIASDHGVATAAEILNKKSGLLALGGASDMRTLSQAQTKEARFAIGHFTYWAVRHAGSMIAAMGGIDALAFTGGIGENDPNIRAAIMEGLAFTGLDMDAAANAKGDKTLHTATSIVSAWIVPAQEERAIAAAALKVLG